MLRRIDIVMVMKPVADAACLLNLALHDCSLTRVPVRPS
jgi:hypothetical protein